MRHPHARAGYDRGMRILIVVALGLATGCISDPGMFVERTGDGEGGVVSSPAGIDCGATCGALFPAHSAVVLTATAPTGSAFLGWVGGGCSGTEPCSLEPGANVTVEARFGRVTHALHVDVTGNGWVRSNPIGITCGTDCDEAMPEGAMVIVEAMPKAGARFVGWSDPACTGPSCAVRMDGDRSVGATFGSVFTVELHVSGPGRVMGSGIDCVDSYVMPSDCAETFAEGDVLTLVATPLPGAAIYSWGNDLNCPLGSLSCTVTVTKNMLIYPKFVNISP